MAYPINATDRLALFSSNDWGFRGTYTSPDGEQVGPMDMLLDETFEIIDQESGAVVERVPAITFNRDLVKSPKRNAIVDLRDSNKNIDRRFVVGDELDADEDEFTARVKEVDR